MRTADLWKIYIFFLFPESIFIINSVKCLVKKISELDHKVSVPRAMPVVRVASKQVVCGQSVKKKRNLRRRLRTAKDALADAVLDVF